MRRVSQNGRWGVELVDWPESDWYGARGCHRGAVKPLGVLSSVSTYQFVPDDQADTWVLVGEDVDPVEGATTVVSTDLQGNSYCSILLLSEYAILRRYQYKRRGSECELWGGGQAPTGHRARGAAQDGPGKARQGARARCGTAAAQHRVRGRIESGDGHES